MDKQKIIVVGAGSAGLNEALIAKISSMCTVEVISPEALQALKQEYTAPKELAISLEQIVPKIEPVYFKPPITRRERRAQQRKK